MYHADGLAALGQLEGLMPASGFLIGAEPSFADVDLYGVLHYAGEGGFTLADLPKVSAFITRFKALPGYGLPTALMPMPQQA